MTSVWIAELICSSMRGFVYWWLQITWCRWPLQDVQVVVDESLTVMNCFHINVLIIVSGKLENKMNTRLVNCRIRQTDKAHSHPGADPALVC